MKQLDLDNYGLTVLNFEHVFTDAYKDIVQDLYMYDKFHDYNVRSQDTKKIYYYHMIKHVCDSVLNVDTDNKVLVYFSIKDIKCDFKQNTNKKTRVTNTDSRDKFKLFMMRFFKHVKNMLPVRVFVGDVKFDTFVQYYNTNKGKYLETINKMRTYKENRTNNYKRLRDFTKKYKLTYLSEQYLNQLKFKCIMYK